MSWDTQVEQWHTLAGEPATDPFFWRVNWPAMASLLPEPAGRVLDIGSGEGRVSRQLHAVGHSVIALDLSPDMLRLTGQGVAGVCADSLKLPFRDRAVEGVVCLMLLMSLDGLTEALEEIARVLPVNGWACFGVLHPLATSGVISDSGELTVRDYGRARWLPPRAIERHGTRLVYRHVHRPVSAYIDASLRSGLELEAVAEPLPSASDLLSFPRLERWASIPSSFMWRARRARIATS